MNRESRSEQHDCATALATSHVHKSSINYILIVMCVVVNENAIQCKSIQELNTCTNTDVQAHVRIQTQTHNACNAYHRCSSGGLVHYIISKRQCWETPGFSLSPPTESQNGRFNLRLETIHHTLHQTHTHKFSHTNTGPLFFVHYFRSNLLLHLPLSLSSRVCFLNHIHNLTSDHIVAQSVIPFPLAAM